MPSIEELLTQASRGLGRAYTAMQGRIAQPPGLGGAAAPVLSLPGGLPPEGSPTLPTPPSDFQPSGTPALHDGGLVPHSGLFNLQQGETVLPAGQTGEAPATQPEVVEMRAYLPLAGGAVKHAKKNPDPKKYWRLAFTPQEARQAYASGDLGETPILVSPQALSFGPQRLLAAAEASRRLEHANPHSTFGEFLDTVQGEQAPPQAQPMPGPESVAPPPPEQPGMQVPFPPRRMPYQEFKGRGIF